MHHSAKEVLCSYTLYRNSLTMLQGNGRGRAAWPPQTLSPAVSDTTALMKEEALRVFCLYTHKTLTELPWKLLCSLRGPWAPSPHLYALQLHLPKSHSSFPFKCFLILIAPAINTFHFPLLIPSATVFPTRAIISSFIFRRFCLLSWKGRMNSLLSKLWKKTWC